MRSCPNTPRRLRFPTLLLLAVAVAAPAQTAPAQEVRPEPEMDPVTGLVRVSTELLVPPGDLEDAWLELTTLGTDAPASVVRIGGREAAEGELRLPTGGLETLPAGAAMLCSGAGSYGVLCEQVFLTGEVWVEPGQTGDVVVRFEPGLTVIGRYQLGGRPQSGARIAVVPAGLETLRAFTMPLGGSPEGSALPREVTSDAQGRFRLPPIAAGEYFLETILASGRVHRGAPFLLPPPASARRQLGPAAAGPRQSARVVWDLGVIDVAEGLIISFQATDLEGRSLAGVLAAGRQGSTPATLVSFQTETDAAGIAYLSGFSVEKPVRLSCRKPGYRTFEQDYPLLPVLVSCVLEPLARVVGEVIGIEGLPPLDAVVSIDPEPAAADNNTRSNTRSNTRGGTGRGRVLLVEPGGRFAAGGLPAGEYRFSAAAPGFEVARLSFTVEPGQRLDLGSIILLAGREVAGRVVDTVSRKPLAAVEIVAVSPPGAVDTVTDADGSFTFVTRTAKPLVLRLTASRHVAPEVTLTPAELTSREPLIFEMERGGFIRAVVWDETTDLPCQGCRLVIRGGGGGRQPATVLLSDAFGVARSPTLSAGDYRVHRPRVTHLGSTVVFQPDAEIRHVSVRRGRTSTVRFGERRRLLRVVFKPTPGPAWMLSARSPKRSEKVFAEASGAFPVRYRPGESLELFLMLFDPLTGSEIEVRQAELPANLAGDELVLPLRSALLSGRATSGGEPLVGVRVRLKTLDDATRAVVRTRADGTFSIPHVEAGVYAVVIGARNVKFVSLREGQSLDIGTFELIAGGY